MTDSFVSRFQTITCTVQHRRWEALRAVATACPSPCPAVKHRIHPALTKQAAGRRAQLAVWPGSISSVGQLGCRLRGFAQQEGDPRGGAGGGRAGYLARVGKHHLARFCAGGALGRAVSSSKVCQQSLAAVPTWHGLTELPPAVAQAPVYFTVCTLPGQAPFPCRLAGEEHPLEAGRAHCNLQHPHLQRQAQASTFTYRHCFCKSPCREKAGVQSSDSLQVGKARPRGRAG